MRIAGEFTLRAWTPGLRSANNPALWRRKVSILGEVWMRVSSVGGVSEIVSWMNGRATHANAAKVVSSETNMCAWVSATGGHLPGPRSSAAWGKNRTSPGLLR